MVAQTVKASACNAGDLGSSGKVRYVKSTYSRGYQVL